MRVGCGRAGFYSNDLLDNLAHPSATTIVADLQHMEIGQWIPMSPGRLTPVEGNRTRLVTRIHAVYDWRHPVTAVFGMLLMEFGDFAMQRRMLRGIKARAESHDTISRPSESAASPVRARA